MINKEKLEKYLKDKSVKRSNKKIDEKFKEHTFKKYTLDENIFNEEEVFNFNFKFINFLD